jgi:SAM-dependent methyltransferase
VSVELYSSALRTAGILSAEYDDGSHERLDVGRWLGALDGADLRLLDRVTGPALDVGCGPGRLAAALSARGIDALGVDIAPDAVALARTRGAVAETLSVFDPLPAEGSYAHVLLIDGNIGIGGDPQRLLTRVAQLLRVGGVALVEVGPAGSRHGSVRARLRGADGQVGGWFHWAHVSVAGLDALASRAGMTVTTTWEDSGRWFADLRT